MCGIAIRESRLEKLKKIGVKDSKLLTKKQREILYKKIIKIAKYKIILVTEEEIDNAVKGKHNLNLNWLEANKTAEIINKLNPNKAFIDTPSPNIGKYRNYILRKLDNKNISLILEHKADLNYPIVSAASIIAKVIRDNEVDKIKKEIGIDFGSGYLTDQKTVEFIKAHHEKFPDIIRKSWSTYKEILNSKYQKNLGDFI